MRSNGMQRPLILCSCGPTGATRAFTDGNWWNYNIRYQESLTTCIRGRIRPPKDSVTSVINTLACRLMDRMQPYKYQT